MIKYYLDLLKDRERIETYQKAISQSVKSGDTVLDLGTGLGTFAFFAAQSGAGKVYAVEKKSIIEMAKEISTINNLHEKVLFYNGYSKEIDLPEKVDLIITEMFWSLFVSRVTMESIKDVRERFLKEGGRLIPNSVKICIAPVSNEKIYDEIISGYDYGIDFTPAKKMVINNMHQRHFKKEDLLSPPEVVKEIDSMNIKLDELPIDWCGSFKSSRGGIIHGLAGWMDLQLTDDIILSNSPLSPSTVWENIFFPIESPLEISEGDTVDVIIKTIPFENDYEWKWDVILPEKGMFESQSTFKGFPLSRDFFKKKSINYTPTLSSDGEVAKVILDLFDGRKTAREIAEGIKKRFPWRFKKIEDTLSRVEKMIYRYSK
ncbi:MAG: 50S ribosomal protein L11 methyltransferase [Nitrospinae bacterium]|nr:50S ribosomal protein L11 methyltransferase [Nitrospinota bacterium]